MVGIPSDEDSLPGGALNDWIYIQVAAGAFERREREREMKPTSISPTENRADERPGVRSLYCLFRFCRNVCLI